MNRNGNYVGLFPFLFLSPIWSRRQDSKLVSMDVVTIRVSDGCGYKLRLPSWNLIPLIVTFINQSYNWSWYQASLQALCALCSNVGRFTLQESFVEAFLFPSFSSLLVFETLARDVVLKETEKYFFAQYRSNVTPERLIEGSVQEQETFRNCENLIPF